MGEKFQRTLALCPECGDYGIATRYDRHDSDGRNVSRSLKIKWCIKCHAVIVLDPTIRVFHPKKNTYEEAYKKREADKEKKYLRNYILA